MSELVAREDGYAWCHLEKTCTGERWMALWGNGAF